MIEQETPFFLNKFPQLVFYIFMLQHCLSRWSKISCRSSIQLDLVIVKVRWFVPFLSSSNHSVSNCSLWMGAKIIHKEDTPIRRDVFHHVVEIITQNICAGKTCLQQHNRAMFIAFPFFFSTICSFYLWRCVKHDRILRINGTILRSYCFLTSFNQQPASL